MGVAIERAITVKIPMAKQMKKHRYSRALSLTPKRQPEGSLNPLSTLFTHVPKAFCCPSHLCSPPSLLGAILAVIVGLVPKLHRVFFADMQDGGWLHAWLTSSIKNVGELFTALQMFVVGSELYKSMDGKEKVGRIPKMGLGLLFAVRFLVWPA